MPLFTPQHTTTPRNETLLGWEGRDDLTALRPAPLLCATLHISPFRITPHHNAAIRREREGMSFEVPRVVTRLVASRRHIASRLTTTRLATQRRPSFLGEVGGMSFTTQHDAAPLTSLPRRTTPRAVTPHNTTQRSTAGEGSVLCRTDPHRPAPRRSTSRLTPSHRFAPQLNASAGFGGRERSFQHHALPRFTALHSTPQHTITPRNAPHLLWRGRG